MKKGCVIKLLYPENPDERLPVVMEHHKSMWIPDKPLSGLDEVAFNEMDVKLILDLIKNDQWIEEESFGLVDLLRSNGVIIA